MRIPAQLTPSVHVFLRSMLTCSSRHMIKYKYVPFDIGRKARYGGQR